MTLEHGPAVARPARRIIFVVLCLALAAALAVLVVRVLQSRETEQPAGGGHGSSTDRAAVLSVTRDFAAKMGSYGPKDLDAKGGLPAYRKRVGELLTTKFRTSFEQEVQLAEQSVKQLDLQVRAVVDSVGVASVDGTHATTLVAWESSSRYGKTAWSDTRLVRSKLALVRVDGEWLVDDFTPVTGEAAQ